MVELGLGEKSDHKQVGETSCVEGEILLFLGERVEGSEEFFEERGSSWGRVDFVVEDLGALEEKGNAHKGHGVGGY